jgi:hypothetical protein
MQSLVVECFSLSAKVHNIFKIQKCRGGLFQIITEMLRKGSGAGSDECKTQKRQGWYARKSVRSAFVFP